MDRSNAAPPQLTEAVPLTARMEITRVTTGLATLRRFCQLFGKLQILSKMESMQDTARTTGAMTGSLVQ